jgi:hypothetical protein
MQKVPDRKHGHLERVADLILLDAETFWRVYTYIELTGIAAKAILVYVSIVRVRRWELSRGCDGASGPDFERFPKWEKRARRMRAANRARRQVYE